MVHRCYLFITFDSFNNNISCLYLLMAYELEVGYLCIPSFFWMCQQNKAKSDLKTLYYCGTGNKSLLSMAKEKRKRKEREEGRKKEKENYRSCTEMPNGCSNRAGYTMRDLRREISFVGLNSEFKMTIVLTHFLLFFFLDFLPFLSFCFWF